MKLYTSYFAQIKNFPKNLVGLSTAVWNPKWLQKGQDKNGAFWLDIPPLKPGKECNGLCAGKCNPKHPEDCEFLRIYYQQLKKLNFNNLISKLENLSKKICFDENFNEVNFAFLVYETPSNLCSERVIIKKWFHENGWELEEWKKI